MPNKTGKTVHYGSVSLSRVITESTSQTVHSSESTRNQLQLINKQAFVPSCCLVKTANLKGL